MTTNARAPGTHDVVVVGAGPAGTAAAITMQRAGLDVAVVTGAAARPPRSHLGQTAPPGTDRLVIDTFGTDDAFDAGAHLRSLGNRSAWDGDELGHTDFMFNPFGTGWHLDRAAFDARLLDVTTRAGVAVVQGELTGSRRASTWALDVRERNGRRRLSARFVVDASGRRAVVARAHGAQLVRNDRLVAAIGVVPECVDACDHVSTVAAVPDGWWFTTPVPGGRRVVSFFTDPDLHRAGALGDRWWFTHAAQRAPHVGTALPEHSGSMSQPVVVAAGTTRLSAPFGDDWLAAGDAAATFDPLSSQGVLTALLTGTAAGNAAAAALGTAHPVAHDGHDALRAYGAIVRQVVDDYEQERVCWYEAETRFADQPFWARRQRCETRSHSK